jgi:hypothetical protein
VVAAPAVERALIPAPAARPVAVLAAERAPAWGAHQVQIQAVHQVQVQAELAQALMRVDGTNGNGTTGFGGIDVSTKRYADGGSGVPPRGRPV